jgi:hypothetical protein
MNANTEVAHCLRWKPNLSKLLLSMVCSGPCLKVLTDDGWDSAPSLGVGCDAAEEVKELLWLVIWVNQLHLVGDTFLF